MTFVKYPSIENHYQQKHVMRWLQEFPNLEQSEFVLLEKLDGANIQVHITSNEIKLGKRNGYIGSESFYGIQSIWPKYLPIFEQIQRNENRELIFYGEIYGEGVQKRINYGEKQLRFFDLFIPSNYSFVNWYSFKDWSTLYNIPCVREVARVTGFTNALTYNNEFKTDNEEDAEGLIIRPFLLERVNNLGKRLIFKSKSSKFAEKMYDRKTEKPLPSDSKTAEYFYKFCEYINKNRVLSVFSKEGEIDKPQDIGQYIKWVLADAKEDFLKDHELPEDVNEKRVFNAGHLVVPILKEYL